MKPDAKSEPELPRRIKNAESVLSFWGKTCSPKVWFIFSEKAIYFVDRLGDEVNATQKGSKTYEATNSSIHIP